MTEARAKMLEEQDEELLSIEDAFVRIMSRLSFKRVGLN